MVTLKAHFDGRVLVPEEPVDLPLHRTLEVQVQDNGAPTATPRKAATASEDPQGGEATELAVPPLLALAQWAETLPPSQLPPDAAEQHDHYLYGTPKRQP